MQRIDPVRWSVTLGATALAATALTACQGSPDDAEDFRQIASSGRLNEVHLAWKTPPPRGRQPIVDGLLKTDSPSARSFLVDRLVDGSVALTTGTPAKTGDDEQATPQLQPASAAGILVRHLAESDLARCSVITKILVTLPAELISSPLVAQLGTSSGTARQCTRAALDACCPNALATEARSALTRLEGALAGPEPPEQVHLSVEAVARSLSAVPDIGTFEPWSARLASALHRRNPGDPTARRNTCAALRELRRLQLPGLTPAISAGYPATKTVCATCEAGPEPVDVFVETYGPELSPRDVGAIRQGLKTWREAEATREQARSTLEQAQGEVDSTREALDGNISDLRDAQESSTTYRLTGWIVAELGDQTYEVQPLGARYYPDGRYPTSSHVILVTTLTRYTTTGRFTTWVEEQGTREMQMRSGFVAHITVVVEAPLLELLEPAIRAGRSDLRDAERVLSQKRRELSSAERATQSTRSSLQRTLDGLPRSLGAQDRARADSPPRNEPRPSPASPSAGETPIHAPTSSPRSLLKASPFE